MLPADHAQCLSDYLALAPHFDIPSDNRFARPVLRHPDFSPSNILVNSSTGEITGLIDWQHAVISPLCLAAGIPKHFQNWGDPLSESLAKPEIELPANFDQLGPREQEEVKKTIRRRLVHFYYAALTLKHMPDHFDAIRDTNIMLRSKLFDRAGAPWEGDSVSLKSAIILAKQHWPMPMPLPDDEVPASTSDFPVKYTAEEIRQCLANAEQEGEKMQEVAEMKEFIGIDDVGWVPDDEHLDNARAVRDSIKAGLLEHSDTEIEKMAVLHHFPFEDHNEDVEGAPSNSPLK